MEGRRFGIGIAAGLLLGFAVFAGSGGLAALSSGVTSVSGSFSGPPATTTTASQLLTSVTLSRTATSTAQQPANAVGGSSVTTTSTSPPTLSPSGSGEKDLASTTTPDYSSQVQSIAHQPAFSDAVVFFPVLLALILGAVVYRVSGRSREARGEGPS